MKSLRKNPRALKPNLYLDEWAKAREKTLALESCRLSEVEAVKTDPLEFFRQVLGVEPTDYQKELIELFQNNQFVAARWSRQSGKSFTTSGILLNYALAHEGVYIGVVGPSWRQTSLLSVALAILPVGYRLAQRLPFKKHASLAPTAASLRLSQTIQTPFEDQPYM